MCLGIQIDYGVLYVQTCFACGFLDTHLRNGSAVAFVQTRTIRSCLQTGIKMKAFNERLKDSWFEQLFFSVSSRNDFP